MLYLAVTFLIISCFASTVALAALMRSAQITRQLEQNGMQSFEQLTRPFHYRCRNGLRRPMVPARRLPTP